VGDKHHGEVVLVDQLQNQIEDLRLDGDVEGRYRFIGDNKFRFGGDGAANGDALALAAGEFVGIFADIGAGKAHVVHQFQHLGGDGFAIGQAMYQ